jgi:hypothetical protein
MLDKAAESEIIRLKIIHQARNIFIANIAIIFAPLPRKLENNDISGPRVGDHSPRNHATETLVKRT